MKRAYFVTGTDTEVGKTFISCSLLSCAQEAGLQTLGLKPVAAGADERGYNDDALQLIDHSTLKLPYEVVNPICLDAPLSPHIAAAYQNRSVDVDGLRAKLHSLDEADFTLVEGAGGWFVPINKIETLADFATSLRVPVVLVIGMRLGCLNHALLTVEAIRASGARLAGWVANQIAPDMAAVEENFETLKSRIHAPCVGMVPFLSDTLPSQATQYLDINKLFES